MKRVLFLLYDFLAYCAFFGTILYAICFVGKIGVANSIDGNPHLPLVPALIIDASLLLLFAFQHSTMARPAFKRWWVKYIPAPIERSTYVLFVSGSLTLLMWQWQPIGGVIWEINNHTAQTVVMIINLTGWVIVFISTYLINDFDLFGLKQTWLNFIDRPSESLPLRLPHFYKIIRHPIYLGFMLAFWSTSTMTVAHMFFALLTTLYILTAIQLEERDLTIHYGGKYIDYKKRMPMIIPFSKRKKVKTS